MNRTTRQFARLKRWQAVITSFLLGVLLWSTGCVPKAPAEEGGAEITVYGFSIMKEVMEKSIYPGFAAKWKREHKEQVRFMSSFAGSETITNQILRGVSADVAILSIERDAERLRSANLLTSDWHALPHRGIINKTPFMIVVRKGNPKEIHDFPDLAKPGIKLIHPDPISSGGAQWSLLAVYGSELVKSEKETGANDQARSQHILRGVWGNVISTPGSAREARTQFEAGYGDALITYELEGLLMKAAGGPIEIVVPQATIFSEHPAVMIDKNVSAARRPLVEAFMEYLWSDEAQAAFVKYHFRSVTNEKLNETNPDLARISMPFSIDYFGGWSRAYPEVIEQVWRDQIQARR
jgi:sulfate transport system substrate-binding protein